MDPDQRLHDLPGSTPRSTDAPPLLAADHVRRQHERVVARFFDGRRLTGLPSKRKSQLEVLLDLASWFTPGVVYDEVQVNAVLREAHDDVAALRRALVDAGYMVRNDGHYRLASSAPERPAHLRAELPAWESVWLPGYLASRTADTTDQPGHGEQR